MLTYDEAKLLRHAQELAMDEDGYCDAYDLAQAARIEYAGHDFGPTTEVEEMLERNGICARCRYVADECECGEAL